MSPCDKPSNPVTATDTEKELDNDILASLAFPQMHDRRCNIDIPHFQTCRWVFDLEQYQSWRAKLSGLLWIKGKPGAGKSTLMSQLYSRILGEHVEHRGALIEFFFTARGEPLQHTPLGMFRSLLNQIFYQDLSIRDYLRKPYKEKCASFGGGRRVWEWQCKELEQLLLEVTLELSKKRQLTIFIDALDEAGEQSAREIARYFHIMNDRIVKASGTARICISCRHYPIPSSVQSVEITVEDYNRDDIDAYVRDHISLDVTGHSELNAAGWRKVIDSLVGQAQGVFQWVRLVVPMLEKYLVDGTSPEDALQWLRQAPEELEEVYKHILQEVIDKRYRKQSLRLFQWVCLATRPLTVTELRYALASHDITFPPLVKCVDTKDFITSDEIMKLRIKSWSGGLVETMTSRDDEKMRVQVIHQSVNDFFLAQGLSFLAAVYDHGQKALSTTPPPISEVIPLYHGSLYRCCLSYITTVPPSSFGPVGSYLLTRQEAGKVLNAALKEYPLVDYAILNALTHANKAGNSRGLNLREEFSVVTHAMPTWVAACTHVRFWSQSALYEGSTILHVAATADMTDLAQYAVQKNVAVNAANRECWTALHQAARCGNINVTKTLVSADASLEMVEQERRTPLVVAASYGHTKLFTWLLEHGASLAAADESSTSACHAAASEGHIIITKLCIQAGADVNAQGGYYGNALQAASLRGHDETVHVLMEAGADVNAQGGYYGNALQAASLRGHDETVHVLMEAGADVNAQGGEYGNALQAASWGGHDETVRILIDAGADVNAQGGYYGNALQAASWGGRDATVRMLIDAGADVNAQGGQYGNALQAASIRGYDETVQTLIEAGVDVNVQGGECGNALQAASYRGRVATVRMLIDAGADVNAQGGWYGNALQAASIRGHDGIASILVEAGANE